MSTEQLAPTTTLANKASMESTQTISKRIGGPLKTIDNGDLTVTQLVVFPEVLRDDPGLTGITQSYEQQDDTNDLFELEESSAEQSPPPVKRPPPSPGGAVSLSFRSVTFSSFR
jgi:hypothetical protein